MMAILSLSILGDIEFYNLYGNPYKAYLYHEFFGGGKWVLFTMPLPTLLADSLALPRAALQTQL